MTNDCTLTLNFQRLFDTGDYYDLKFDTEAFGATGVIVTMTEINALGIRNRKTSDIMTATMMSWPYYDAILIPEEVLTALVDDKEETDPTKWRYEKKEWW